AVLPPYGARGEVELNHFVGTVIAGHSHRKFAPNGPRTTVRALSSCTRQPVTIVPAIAAAQCANEIICAIEAGFAGARYVIRMKSVVQVLLTCRALYHAHRAHSVSPARTSVCRAASQVFHP